MSLFLSLVGAMFFGSVIWTLESGTWNDDGNVFIDSNGNVSAFQSAFDGMYFAVITMTTVGYGDVVPLTTPGYIVTASTAFVGIVLLAIPISIIRCDCGDCSDHGS